MKCKPRICIMKNIFLLIIWLISGFQASAKSEGCLQDWTKFKCKHSEFNFTTEDMCVEAIDSVPENNREECPLARYVKKYEFTLKIKNIKQNKQHSIDTCKKSQNKIICVFPKSLSKICNYKKIICKGSSSSVHVPSWEINANSSCKKDLDNACIHHWEREKSEPDENTKKLILRVLDVTTFEKSSSLGTDLTYYCKYNGANYPVICKGEDPTKCQVIGTINNKQRFKINKIQPGHITIEVRGITANDFGTYWCRTNPENRHKQELFHRFILHLDTTSKSTALPSTSSKVFAPTSNSPATSAAKAELGPGQLAAIIIGAAGLLLLVIVIFAFFKRCLEKPRDGSTGKHPKEDCIYEEIPDDLRPTTISVYSTVNLPTNDPASLHYSTIRCPTSSTKKADGEVLVLNPSSSSCQYSVLNYSQSSTTQTEPQARNTDKPLYSTVKKPVN